MGTHDWLFTERNALLAERDALRHQVEVLREALIATRDDPSLPRYARDRARAALAAGEATP